MTSTTSPRDSNERRSGVSRGHAIHLAPLGIVHAVLGSLLVVRMLRARNGGVINCGPCMATVYSVPKTCVYGRSDVTFCCPMGGGDDLSRAGRACGVVIQSFVPGSISLEQIQVDSTSHTRLSTE